MAPKTSPERILRIGDVTEVTGLSRSVIYALSASGKFPRQKRLSPGSTGWLASDVTAWIEALEAA
jgi:prophage regulatory protein